MTKIKSNLLQEYYEYAESCYPSNHTYKISGDALSPKCKLKTRYKKISRLYPLPLTSLLDVGCSKGFFVFSASQAHASPRNLGIDVNTYNITYCSAIKQYLSDQSSKFAELKLDELTNRIDEFGGSYQTILLINAYQYLYFGSSVSSECYQKHDVIFQNLRKICTKRVIFNNRVNLVDCQKQNPKLIEKATLVAQNDYSEEKILEAASRYFNVSKMGKIGRYPLWALDVV